MSGPQVDALVPAAGAGVRLGGGVPKALRLLAGEPLLVHAVRSLRAWPELGDVVVAAPPGAEHDVARLVSPLGARVVTGGAERQDSVRACLAATSADLVLVHDAARALVPREVVERVVQALRDGADAVVPVVAVADTVKSVDGDVVTATVDRSALRAVQTPQGFRRDLLARAHAAATAAATDDAALVEALGGTVVVVDGHDEAFKVTRPVDLLLAEAVLRGRA